MGKLIILAAVLFAALQYIGEPEAQLNTKQPEQAPKPTRQSPVEMRVNQSPKLAVSPARKPAPMIMNFRCDGRQYCGQMTSRAEAEYFLQHCPDTRMDGDDDGIPCENDTRF